MPLLALPTELLQIVLGWLEEKQMFPLLRVNRDLYTITLPYLYQHNVHRSGSSALPWYAQRGHEAGVRRLLSFNADVNALDEDDVSALRLAVNEGHVGVVRLLLEHGADVQKEKFRFIHGAVRRGNTAVVKLLLDYGGDVNAVDEYNTVPLKEAAIAGNREMVRLLLEYGARVNQTRVDGSGPAIGASPLHGAASFKNQKIEVLELLLDHGAHPGAVDHGGQTPLHWAIVGEPREDRINAKLTLLLENGADVNAKDGTGGTPLHTAASWGKDAVMQCLLNYGADSTAVNNRGLSPAGVYRDAIRGGKRSRALASG
ncbi:uncharacterized protein N7459_006351 [Penicillium hispanicum]|uniref:uncharacterized protein n=1 Tax=Penicillium hispanicum TaxID=1080232 RepID=UPI002542546D|nr:uncharacterized protein N7459_006351 [Penicillium hispanicum]KAJ5577387.1 hypothetical protein N7459_006351 [Penicillium hispanicum]